MKAYVDGSARPTNPGFGRFAIVVCDDNDNVLYTIEHNKDNVTNNAMEMAAIVSAVLLYGRGEDKVQIFSDSAYAVNALTQWSFGWKLKGWCKGDNKVPENLELIKEYHKLLDNGYHANIGWVKGHNTCDGNILADKIANGSKKGDYII